MYEYITEYVCMNHRVCSNLLKIQRMLSFCLEGIRKLFSDSSLSQSTKTQEDFREFQK